MEYITRKGYEKLYQDFLQMESKIIEAHKKMGESAKRDNDLRENSEYMDLRVQAMYSLPEKRKQLFQRYQTAIIIEETDDYKKFDGTKVIIGSKVQLIFDGYEEEYTILGNEEGNLDEDIISCESPLAQVLIGKKVGETIDFNGISIKIISVKRI